MALEEDEDGTPVRRALSFDDALRGSGRKRQRTAKSPKMKQLRKKLSTKLAPHQDDVMEGPLWDEERGGLAIGFVLVLFLCCFV